MGLLSFSVIVATGSLIAAIVNIKRNQKLARQRATLDLIEKVETNELYRKMDATFRKCRDNAMLRLIGNPKLNASSEEHLKELEAARQDVMDVLNHNELVAIGIRAGILDEWFYKYWLGGSFVKVWNEASEFIQQERWRKRNDDNAWHYHDEFWHEYQTLARKWSHETKFLDRSSGGPDLTTAGGPGDKPYPLTE